MWIIAYVDNDFEVGYFINNNLWVGHRSFTYSHDAEKMCGYLNGGGGRPSNPGSLVTGADPVRPRPAPTEIPDPKWS
jgi:hypothetical protein